MQSVYLLGEIALVLIDRKLGNNCGKELWLWTLCGWNCPSRELKLASDAVGSRGVWSARKQNIFEVSLQKQGASEAQPSSPYSAPSWCLEQTAGQSLLQVRWPASVLTRTDTIENCIRRRAIGICSKYITEHKWLADTACLAVCKGNGSMDFWIRREGLFFLCAGTSTWWLGRKLI